LFVLLVVGVSWNVYAATPGVIMIDAPGGGTNKFQGRSHNASTRARSDYWTGQ
jgi:hypothetical protein